MCVCKASETSKKSLSGTGSPGLLAGNKSKRNTQESTAIKEYMLQRQNDSVLILALSLN